MKKQITTILLGLISLVIFAQTPTRIYDLPSSGTPGDNMSIVLDQSGWTTYKTNNLLALKNYCTTGFTPSGDITLDFARINGNSFTGTVNYNVSPTTGYFMRASNSSGAMQWVNLATYLPWASTAEVSGMSDVTTLLKPYNQPIVRLNGGAANTNGQTIDYNGLRLYRYWNGHQIEWRLGQDFYSLTEVLASGVDPYLASIVIDNDDDPRKLGFLGLVNLINAQDYTMVITPPVYNIPFALEGTTTTADDYIVRVEIYMDGTENSGAYNASHFASENLVNTTSVTFTARYDISSANYYMEAALYIPATVVKGDGSEFAGADIIYTNASTGVQVRGRFSIYNPIVSGGGGGMGGVDDDLTFVSVHIVDTWPTTETQGIYFKLGEGIRVYYIDKGSCAFGYQSYDGTGGVCIESK